MATSGNTQAEIEFLNIVGAALQRTHPQSTTIQSNPASRSLTIEYSPPTKHWFTRVELSKDSDSAAPYIDQTRVTITKRYDSKESEKFSSFSLRDDTDKEDQIANFRYSQSIIN